MNQIELSAGTIDYEDTGGDGPTLVLLHGFLMDASLWDDVIADLSADHRCVAPTLPLGAHRHAMHADSDLSLRGIARLVSELIDRLDLRDVTVVGNDTGGALVQLLACDDAPASAGSSSLPATRSTTSHLASPARRWCSRGRCRRRCSACSCSTCACGLCGGSRSRSGGSPSEATPRPPDG